MAGDVGWGHFQQKGQAISKWVERATTFAQDLVQHEQAEEDVLQRVNMQALAALAGVAEPPDASKWINDYVGRAGRMIEHATDEARQSQLEWELGLVLSDAASIAQARGHYEKSLEYGRLALKHLEAGEPAGQQLPYHDFVMGQLLYKLGATAAVGEQNHRRALEWYGRAVTLLEKPVPPSRLADPGRHGETFVSIAVSYWEAGKREEALRLTKQGIKLMEQAIEEGLLAKSVLAVPYSNLASMHAELGDKQLAAEFAELAAKCERTKR
jgi:tetratricopeptide (TPR) repeat protein